MRFPVGSILILDRKLKVWDWEIAGVSKQCYAEVDRMLGRVIKSHAKFQAIGDLAIFYFRTTSACSSLLSAQIHSIFQSVLELFRAN
jgi:pyruvate carboxylase